MMKVSPNVCVDKCYHVLNIGGLPFEDEGNDKVRVDSDSPVTLFPRRVRLGVVRRQNYPRGSTDVTPTGCCRQAERERETKRGKEYKNMITQHWAWVIWKENHP